MPPPASMPWRNPSSALLLFLLLLLSSPYGSTGQTAELSEDERAQLSENELERLENTEKYRFQYSTIDGSFLMRSLDPGVVQAEYAGYPPIVSLYTYQSPNVETMTDYLRGENPDGKGAGTRNWKKLKHGSQSFTRRNGHATTIYKCPIVANTKPGTMCIWLIGGRSEEYQAYDLEFTRRNADIYYSTDGNEWFQVGWQVGNLEGDFIDGIGNFDAKFPGKRPVAPFYSRFGHTLDAVDIDGDGETDAMILIGGYNPEPSNDVWISVDGINWSFDGYAPFTERAWHATAIFKGQLVIVGGAPLSNDVWVGDLVMKPGLNYNGTLTASKDMTMTWRQKVSAHHPDTPFSPRSGHCILTQLRRNFWPKANETGSSFVNTSTTDRMYIIGGFASWPREDPRYDGERSRNDVYVSTDGANWEKVEPPCEDGTTVTGVNGTTCQKKMSMDWAARAWHGCATFHKPGDRSVDINQAAVWEYEKNDGDGNEIMHPKMYIMGGGYIGTKRNHVIRKMEAYVDTWWSRDGINWQQVNLADSSGAALFTTQEWAQTSVEGVPINIGKWGFSLEVFHREEDMNGDGYIDSGGPGRDPKVVAFDFAGNQIAAAAPGAVAADAAVNTAGMGYAEFWRLQNTTEVNIPALMFVAGDTVDAGGLTNDVFVSKPGLLCEKEGITCNQRGVCGPGTMGCVCESLQWLGEYCERLNQDYVSSARLLGPGGLNVALSLIAVVWLLQ